MKTVLKILEKLALLSLLLILVLGYLSQEKILEVKKPVFLVLFLFLGLFWLSNSIRNFNRGHLPDGHGTFATITRNKNPKTFWFAHIANFIIAILFIAIMLFLLFEKV